ncbi:hypothetical protein TNCV_5003791 [Trichonephila clavipes]|nr:hypothetical protein TNCV_5003791 [Trichonephila clavipes]
MRAYGPDQPRNSEPWSSDEDETRAEKARDFRASLNARRWKTSSFDIFNMHQPSLLGGSSRTLKFELMRRQSRVCDHNR